ncbi:MAG: hypothetical protein OEO77_06730 [Acidimicrobiia bacterium]|nr:hypothetical protein [Acidimicrobiia bacterium]
MTEQKRLVRAIPFGLADAGLASLSTFIAGGYAAATLDAGTLGVYALFFQAFMFGQMVPGQLVMAPIEIEVLKHRALDRLRMVRHVLHLNVLVCLVSSLIIPIVALVAVPGVSSDIVLPLALTAAAVTFWSPLQTHVRRLMHLSDTSWAASITSTIQLVVMVAAILAGRAFEVGEVWLPFGTLALANIVSFGWAYVWAIRRSSRLPAMARPEIADLIRSGGWLLTTGGTTAAAGLLVAFLVQATAGLEVLGYAEAARVLSQPVFVLAVGLNAVFGPRSMEAASRRDQPAAQSLRRTFIGIVLVTGAMYAALVAVPWSWSPLPDWFGPAYSITGLLAVSVLGNLSQGMVFSRRSEIVGAKLLRELGLTEVLGTVLRVGAAASAGLTGAFAVPLGLIGLNLVRALRYQITTNRWYQGSILEPDTSLP